MRFSCNGGRGHIRGTCRYAMCPSLAHLSAATVTCDQHARRSRAGGSAPSRTAPSASLSSLVLTCHVLDSPAQAQLHLNTRMQQYVMVLLLLRRQVRSLPYMSALYEPQPKAKQTSLGLCRCACPGVWGVGFRALSPAPGEGGGELDGPRNARTRAPLPAASRPSTPSGVVKRHATDTRPRQMAEGLQKMLRTYARIMSRRRHRMRLLLLLQVVGLKCRPGWRLTAYP